MKKSPSFADIETKTPKPRGILNDHKKKVSKEIGRPLKRTVEKSTEKVTAYLTVDEKAIFSKKAGLIKESTFLKHILKEGGYLD